MVLQPYSYNLYHDFIESYLPSGFMNIDGEDPIIKKLEKETERNDQFFTASDMTKIAYLYSSKRSQQLIGYKPEQISPAIFVDITHPDDLHRLDLCRMEMIKIANDIYSAKKGSTLMSFTLRLRNPSGEYNNFLGQAYFFYSKIPVVAVFLIQVITKIDWFKMTKHGSHYYIGNDMSLFRFPDEKLLKVGHNISDREFEIIKLIEKGLTSKQIAEKLFLSAHTVDNHRSKILKKMGKVIISDAIYDLKNTGLL
jgi:DNA-binding CsgD family transcriptional regulator